jgi:hypothetical protein
MTVKLHIHVCTLSKGVGTGWSVMDFHGELKERNMLNTSFYSEILNDLGTLKFEANTVTEI